MTERAVYAAGGVLWRVADGRLRVALVHRTKYRDVTLPKGKVEPGERPEHALIRELKEELGIDVNEACLAPFVFASHAYDSFHLLMPLYLCRRWDGVVAAREHDALAWVKPDKLSAYPMPPADEPLVAWLRDLL